MACRIQNATKPTMSVADTRSVPETTYLPSENMYMRRGPWRRHNHTAGGITTA